ncbi:polyketide cyclase [Planctomycetota bacterium]|nr:polyketide cyclase [Planctomycetota bacterium]
MRKIAFIILGLVLVVVAALVLVVAVQPAEFAITRSLAMNAPPAAIFAEVNDFKRWGGWSPWEKIDPNLKRTYGEITAGVGAVYRWQGNDQVGEGSMTISSIKPDQQITIKLEFLKPFAAKNQTIFDFTPTAAGTTVTWTMRGRNDFMTKAVCLFMDMDKMVGADFEKGLAQLKALSGTAPAKTDPPQAK